MPIASLPDVDIYYETMGDPSSDPLVLVMGFTAQLITWPTGFCESLVDLGYFVIRHDNRDCGLSSKTEGDPPDSMTIMTQAQSGQEITVPVPYTLSDMAGDVIGLLDHLGIDQAHVVGASMGGMIVQTLAIEHPNRLKSVTSIMSTTGDAAVGAAAPEAMAALLTPAPEDRYGAIVHGVKASQVIAGPLWDEAESLRRTTAAYDRSNYPEGATFQMAAIFASGDRTERLTNLDLPFLVVHGLVDQLINVTGGHATAAAVPNADLLVLSNMGHDIPPQYWPQLTTAIHGIANRTL